MAYQQYPPYFYSGSVQYVNPMAQLSPRKAPSSPNLPRAPVNYQAPRLSSITSLQMYTAPTMSTPDLLNRGIPQVKRQAAQTPRKPVSAPLKPQTTGLTIADIDKMIIQEEAEARKPSGGLLLASVGPIRGDLFKYNLRSNHEMLLYLAHSGTCRDADLMHAMTVVSREKFVPRGQEEFAFNDFPIRTILGFTMW